MGLNTLGLAHKFIAEHVKPGGFCIDATAGRGGDTAFLCGLVGKTGKVLAFDIQEDAVKSTREFITQKGYDNIAQVLLESHSNMAAYAQDETVDCIVFNFGWLPGGNHKIFTQPATSIAAIEQGLKLLKQGGIMSLCIYYGGESGFQERDALLEYLKTIDNRAYTVLVTQFYNRPNNPPIPVFITKDV
ncbi:putative rRNA methylase [Hydrogenoanaerobacterium saccharovorans]|uniref:Putative rRNA methylase n=1 Tax=Hydrogenoanaerobacterium saccharovorans TaxID=474960 RepID=A0A1H8DTI3_9FIRM|nr:class I SAM-dependent methyltransferase [Hydrogenoanaerobacterium saccharovorans]RPF42367.1 putative rRNA methylase [Hydrogenoanaerobacterium saccharovorans]SEN10174.1 Putative rRNA methylase [Hydrogenoanaerobacterium saccharovorans]